MRVLQQKNIVLGVSGSVAAYKAIYLTRLLREADCHVHPILTAGATRFVGALSFACLAGRPAITNLWAAGLAGEVGHVELAQRADACVVAPASANTLARLAAGVADDPLGALWLSCRAPKLLAPAMESHMWEHPSTQAHVRALVALGATLVEPNAGSLASGRTGVGRMAEPEAIVAALSQALTPADLRGKRVLVTAGPTREFACPARFLSNPSTGKMGYALAAAARERGAEVCLVSGPTKLSTPPGVQRVNVTTCAEMLAACITQMAGAHVLVMAAAPADWRFAQQATQKGKKSAQQTTWQPQLVSTPDILLQLRPQAHGVLCLGFAAETEALLAYGEEKRQRKALDLLFVNRIGTATTGFGADTNAGTLLSGRAAPLELPLMSKRALAHSLVDALVAYV